MIAHFRGCNNLISLIIPNSITIIGSHAFQDCNSLTTVVIPSKITSSGDYTTIGDYAFSNCTELKSIVIPAEVTTTGEYAFYCCNKLTMIYSTNGSYAQNYAMRNNIPFTSVFPAENYATANPAKFSISLDSGSYELSAYSINENWYFKLRDIAKWK